MLRITVDQDDTSCRLKLAGRLCGLWVAETKRAWRSSPCLGKQIEVDMRELTSIGDYGRELLSAMYQAGARLVVEGCVDERARRGDHSKSANRCPNGAVPEKESSRRPMFQEQEK